MEAHEASGASFDRAPADHFTGDVWAKYGPGPEDGSTTVVVVNFSPGARTHWHSHNEGQYIYVIEGRGRVRSKGEAGVSASPGDILWVPPGQEHFHGAAPDAPLVHFAFNGGGSPRWGEAVTDQEYEEGF